MANPDAEIDLNGAAVEAAIDTLLAAETAKRDEAATTVEQVSTPSERVPRGVKAELTARIDAIASRMAAWKANEPATEASGTINDAEAPIDAP